MTDTNILVLLGRVVKQPEVRKTSAGVDFITFHIAVNKSFKTDNGFADRASFFPIAVFGEKSLKPPPGQ